MNQDAPILIVDDQLAFRIMLTVLLEDAGYGVASAANGGMRWPTFTRPQSSRASFCLVWRCP
jgi:CheY-like chemotaxis protein